MTVIQVWLLVGVPVLVASLALFTARAEALGAAGVVVALGGAVAVAMVDQASAVALGVIAVLMYAAGSAGRGAVNGHDPVRSPSAKTGVSPG